MPAERVLLVALFAVYLSLLVWIVLWKLEVPFIGTGATRTIKLVPFLSTMDAGPSAPSEVAANILIFVPFGLYLGMLKPTWPVWTSACIVAGSSLLLEVIQYVLAIGVADITDVLANAAGGVAGVGLYRLSRRALTTQTEVVLRWVCLVGTVVALLVCVIVVASSLRYGAPMNMTPHNLPTVIAG
ncbi:VanZ family protein [Lysinibacter cavernae]|uniref:Glycopeptide antibiotics resistance protein n=1 Tax=Lysinibacter cavernae TaxID=1640652 RepID=A0A7X5R0B6_9MICO|nr:VanZ family protein [Lysinibacter cavernae]NIH53261.1 glycopeptide antibiotics resistance protein [Lysinibacter cavernae]